MHSKLMFMLIIHSIWVRTVVGVLNIQAGLLGQFSVKSTVKSNFFFFFLIQASLIHSKSIKYLTLLDTWMC